MKLEINDALSSVLTTVVICTAIVGGILGIGYMVYDSSVKTNAAIAHATSCEAAVLLQGGGADTTNRIIACKVQRVGVAAPSN